MIGTSIIEVLVIFGATFTIAFLLRCILFDRSVKLEGQLILQSFRELWTFILGKETESMKSDKDKDKEKLDDY